MTTTTTNAMTTTTTIHTATTTTAMTMPTVCSFLDNRMSQAWETLANFECDNFKMANLERHTRSRLHREALSSFLGLGDDLLGAPAKDDFRKLWDALRAGNSGRQGIQGIGAQHKLAKMAWCLFESMCDLDRKFFESRDLVIALHRDERHTKIKIRFSAVNASLKKRRGILGITTHIGGGHKGINHATRKIIKDMFTTRKAPPRPFMGYKGRKEMVTSTVNEDDFNNFCKSVELINVDAAPDEILAAYEGKKSEPGSSALTPMARFVARDKSHGARRKVNRGERGAGAWGNPDISEQS